jgi:hypothetical protein
MKRVSRWYLALMILDIILLIAWPIVVLTASYPTLLAFLVGVVWCTDLYDFFKHRACYKEAKFYEGFEEVK